MNGWRIKHWKKYKVFEKEEDLFFFEKFVFFNRGKLVFTLEAVENK